MANSEVAKYEALNRIVVDLIRRSDLITGGKRLDDYLGMMPHPGAYHHRTNHPRWTREELPEEGMGGAFFGNTVQYIRSRLL